MMQVKLYSRADCHLCEQAKAELDALRGQLPHELVVIDVDSSPELQHKYGFNVPVLEIGPYKLSAPITTAELRVTLGAALDRERHIDMIQNATLEGENEEWTRADGFSYWIARYYMLLFNIFVALYLGLAFLAPALMKAGQTAPAALLYKAYGISCHQLAFRSFFVFGEQPFYPRQAAGVQGVMSFNQATGLSEGSEWEDIFKAEGYLGDERVGYKVALCERDVAIYASILLFGLIFMLTGRPLRALPWYVWIILGLGPIGLDGFSQLLSQPPLSFLPYRESTPLLRALTGGLFGFATAWFGYPTAGTSMSESSQLLGAKLKRIQRAAAKKQASETAYKAS